GKGRHRCRNTSWPSGPLLLLCAWGPSPTRLPPLACRLAALVRHDCPVQMRFCASPAPPLPRLACRLARWLDMTARFKCDSVLRLLPPLPPLACRLAALVTGDCYTEWLLTSPPSSADGSGRAAPTRTGTAPRAIDTRPVRTISITPYGRSTSR